MKTLSSKKSKASLKLALGLLVAGLSFNAPSNTVTTRAELVDETDEWEVDGEEKIEDITPEEQEQHDEQPNPAVQDGEAVVDNTEGGEEPSVEPQKPEGTGSEGNSDPKKGEITDWEDWDPTKDPTWDPVHPKLPDNLPDEVDIKNPTPTPTPKPTPTPNPTPTPTPKPTPTPGPKPTPGPQPVVPVTPITPCVPVVPVVVTPAPVVKTTVPKAGAEDLPYVLGGGSFAGLAYGIKRVIDSKKKYSMHKKIQKVLKKTK